MFYIISGTGKIFINDCEIPLIKDSIFYCCGGSNYSIYANQNLDIYSLNFDLSQNKSEITLPFTPQKFNKTEIFLPVDNFTVDDSRFLNSYLMMENCVEFKNSIIQITKTFSSQSLYFRETCSCMLKNLLIEMHRAYYEAPDNFSDIVNKVIEYMGEIFSKDIDNGDLTNFVGYHKYYLNRLFVRYTGTSMHPYVAYS